MTPRLPYSSPNTSKAITNLATLLFASKGIHQSKVLRRLESGVSYIVIDGKYWVAKDLTLANFGDLVAAEKPDPASITAGQAANRPAFDKPKPQSEGYALSPSLAELRPLLMMPAGADIKEEDEDLMAVAMADEENDEEYIDQPELQANVILDASREPHLLIFSPPLPRYAVLLFDDVHAEYLPAPALDDFEHQQHAPMAPMAS
ncbi:hypothetical protein CFIO01_00325 [Colletotrichum fioriniae PJ7]|uniref:Uncharacterized protein n=1 Tax=Colletotrichum fioriniae PJ7 TaxID=1445577 RepID=A0A010QNR2_9PEZI|nr:hypothetical protein CFIO01_00325 [Colletotrichum fioriniae PJ7]